MFVVLVVGVFFTLDDVVRFLRLFRRLPCDISDELRGWCWGDYPVVPSFGVRVSVWEVAGGFCSCGRDVYLRRVLGVVGRSSLSLRVGGLVHRVFHEAVRAAKGLLYRVGEVDGFTFHKMFSGLRAGVLDKFRSEFSDVPVDVLEGVVSSMWNYAANVYASALDRFRSRSAYLSLDGLVSMVVPMVVEYPIDGSLVGLSRALRVDALLYPNVLVELKVRGTRPEHEVGLAGYALAFESQYEVPVNYGLLVNVRFDKDWRSFRAYEKVVLISDELRMRFIERRDEVMRIVSEGVDPGLSDSCSPYCPYFHVCREGSGG